jgi:hypothetical protein
MVPGATPEGAFRQVIVAWCEQARKIGGVLDAGAELVPKSRDDRVALLDGLARIRRTTARLERQLRDERREEATT